jgi:hypothetical protein
MNENIVITGAARTPMGDQVDEGENPILLEVE